MKRDEPLREIVLKKIRDRLRDRTEIAAAAFSAQAALEGILRIRDVIDTLDIDEKVSIFWSLEGVSTVSYAAQSYIIYSLSRKDNTNRLSIKKAAEILGISYQRARMMAGVWKHVFEPFVERGEEIPELPPRFFEEVYRKANKFGVDPTEAVKYAWEQRIENPTYGYRQLAKDIEAGLPTPEQKELIPSCTRCRHLKSAPEGTKVILQYAGEELAEGDGGGIFYCEVFGLLRREIPDPVEKAKNCVRYEPRYQSKLEPPDD